MSEQRQMLADMVERLFPDLETALGGKNAESGFRDAWQQVEELGLASVLLPEDAGGFGGGWRDAYVVMRAEGLHAVSLPVGENVVARRLLADASIAAPEGALSLARCASTAQDVGPYRFKGVAWGAGNTWLLSAIRRSGEEHIALFDTSKPVACRSGGSAGGIPRFDLQLDESAIIASAPSPGAVNTLMHQGALLRTAQMSGALESALSLTVSHVNDRVQFGRALSKFQAVQHSLALLAEEVAAVGCAAQAACEATDRGDPSFAIAAAKLRANRSVYQATSIAHQLHGAIGFTREHRLHQFTQRLWCWSRDFGNERYWAELLGQMVASGGAANLWSRVTG